MENSRARDLECLSSEISQIEREVAELLLQSTLLAQQNRIVLAEAERLTQTMEAATQLLMLIEGGPGEQAFTGSQRARLNH